MNLSVSRLSHILDKMAEGGGINKVAKEARCSPATIFKIKRDFPLWEYLRTKKDDT